MYDTYWHEMMNGSQEAKSQGHEAKVRQKGISKVILLLFYCNHGLHYMNTTLWKRTKNDGRISELSSSKSIRHYTVLTRQILFTVLTAETFSAVSVNSQQLVVVHRERARSSLGVRRSKFKVTRDTRPKTDLASGSSLFTKECRHFAATTEQRKWNTVF